MKKLNPSTNTNTTGMIKENYKSIIDLKSTIVGSQSTVLKPSDSVFPNVNKDSVHLLLNSENDIDFQKNDQNINSRKLTLEDDKQIIAENGDLDTKLISKTDEKKKDDSPLKNKNRFNGIILWISLLNFQAGYNINFFGAFFLTIENDANFDWDDKNVANSTKLAIFNGIFFLGMCIGTFNVSMFKKISQRKLFIGLCAVSLVAVFTSVMNHIVPFFIGRFLLGYASGLSRPLSSIWIHELSPNSVRPQSVSMWGLVGKIASVTFFFLANFDDGGIYIWRAIFVIQAIPCVLFIIMGLTCYKNIDSVSYYMSQEKTNETKEMLESYMHTEPAEVIIDDYLKIQQKHSEFLIGKDGQKVGFVKVICQNYLRELAYATIISFTFLCTQKTSFWAFVEQFCIIDPRNASEKRVVVGVISCTKIATIIAVSLSMKFKINKYRKRSYTIGLILTAMTWILMGACFFFNFYANIFAMVAAFIFAILDGTTYQIFYTMILEVCGSNFFAWSLGFYYLANFLLLDGVPYLLGMSDNYEYFCLGSGGLILLISIIGSFYFIETEGITQKDSYEILRKKKTRAQVLKEKKLFDANKKSIEKVSSK